MWNSVVLVQRGTVLCWLGEGKCCVGEERDSVVLVLRGTVLCW